MLDYLTIGTIVNVHGVRGEVKVLPETDDINRFKKLKTVELLSNEVRKTVKVESVKLQNKFAILKLEGIDDRDVADTYRGVEVQVERKNAVRLPEDSYYIGDIMGCKVVEEDGSNLGIIDDIFNNVGSDIYCIKTESGKTIMLPAIKDTIINVDIENNLIVVRLLPGLRDIYLATK